MSVFFQKHTDNFQSFVVNLKNMQTIENSIFGVITQNSIQNINCLLKCAEVLLSTHIFVNCTIGMIGNKAGHLLKCVELHRKFVNKSEIQHMLKRNIATSSLKIICEYHNLVKCYHF